MFSRVLVRCSRTRAVLSYTCDTLVTLRLAGGVYGVVIMGMAFAVSTLPGLVEASQLISVTTSGPLLGVFLLALLCPAANKKVLFVPFFWGLL